MKHLFTHRLPVICVMILLILSLVPSAAAGQPPQPGRVPQGGEQTQDPFEVRTYIVSGVSTREERTAIAQTGADIIEVGAGYVILRATGPEASQIAALGYAIEGMAQAEDFPPADSAYHNYAEMVADIQAVATAHPDIVSLFSIGTSYE